MLNSMKVYMEIYIEMGEILLVLAVWIFFFGINWRLQIFSYTLFFQKYNF
jgi:hypothetical protein